MSPPRLTPEQIQDLMEFYGDPQSERSIAERPYEAPITRPVIEPFDIVVPPRDQISPPRTLPSADIADFQAGQMLTAGEQIPGDYLSGANALARSVAQARQARAGGAAAVPPPPPAPPAPAAAPGDTARARVEMETGSQGRTTPSNAADAASVGTRISRYLEQAVGRLAGEQQGFGDIANALMQVRATGGKVNFEQAMRDIESKDFNRATNLANAYSALKKADGAGALSLKDQALIMQRGLDRAAREGNQAALQMNTAINSMVTSFPKAVQPQVREEAFTYIAAWRAANQSENVTPAQLPALMAEVNRHVNSLGLRRGGGEGAPAARPSGGGIYMDGEVERFLPFVPQGRGGLSQQQQAANRAFDRGNEQMALSIARNIDDRAAGRGRGGGGGGAQAERDVAKFREQIASAKTTVDLIDEIRSQIDKSGANIMGATGTLSQIVGGLNAQAQSLLGINDIRRRTSDAVNSFNRELINAPVRTPQEAAANQSLQRAFAWLDGDNSAQAAAFKSNMLILGTSLAKSLDPNGRLSNQDVQQALAIIGSYGRGILTDPNQTKAALASAERYLDSVIESRRSTFPELQAIYPDRIVLRTPRAGGSGAGGAPPPDLRGLSDEEIRNRLRGQ